MLEKMSEFFENRLDGYDEHMLTNIESAREFYPFTAECLPKPNGCRVLDLGCGTGLELEYYFALNPTARVTGIDLSPPVIEGIQRVSKPSCRIHCTCKDIPKVLGGLGTVVLSTPMGILSGRKAKEANVGGEVLLYVW